MTETYRVTYSPAAKDDLKGIYAYIALELKEKRIAKNQVDRIRQAIRSLGQLPFRHVKVDWEPWASMDMRKMPVDHKDKHTVTVIRIFYGGRDIEGVIQNENR